MQTGYEPQALLCERRHITGDAADIIAKCGDIPIYTGERELLAQLTGYTLTRGVLCAMRRRPEPPVAEVIGQSRRIVVIDGVVDTTNIGAIAFFSFPGHGSMITRHFTTWALLLQQWH